MTEIKPVAWHCVGAGDGWAEDKIIRDPETANNYASRPHQWSVRPLYGPEAMAEIERLRKALAALLSRDERNTCQHEETHRGGFLWEICDACGAEWADDEGGKPEWEDPPEWIEARAALASHASQSGGVDVAPLP